MLQSIRDRTQGWIAGVIISLVILSFALWGIHSYMASGASNAVVAKVDGVVIAKNQLASAYERLRRQAQASAGALSQYTEIELKQRALQTLINIQVLKQASEVKDYRISSSQVDNFLENMPEFQVNGQFSLNRFQQLLATTLFTAGDFLELIRTTLLIDQPRLGVIFSAFALPNEVSDTIALVNQERDVEYIMLPRSLFSNQNVVISDNDVLAYYKQHQNEFKAAEQITVEYLQLSLKDLMVALHPSADALKSFYNENINSYTQPMQWNLAKVVIPIPQTTTDQDLAALQKKAADSGNDAKSIGWVTLNKLSSELQKPVSALIKVGQMTAPIRTQEGFVVLKMVGFKDAQVQPFEQVKDKVQDALTRQQAEEKFAELKEKLANITYEYPDSLQPAAKTLGLSVKATELFTRAKGGNDITANKKIREVAFSEDVLNSQNNSDVIQVTPDAALVLRVKSHIPAALLSLNAVQKQIIEELKTKAAEAKLLQRIEEIQKKLQSGVSSEQVAEQYNFTWNKLGFIGRYSTKVDSAILYTAFRMPRPQAGATSSPLYTNIKVPEGYAIVTVKAVRDGNLDNNQEQYEVFADQTQNSEGLLEYKSYEAGLIQQAKITIEDQRQEKESA